MKTLLLCAYRQLDPNCEAALGVDLNAEPKKTLIDRRIAELRAIGHEVVCVIAGAESDTQLRLCHTIQDSELVFDTNIPTSLLSNTTSGSYAAPNEACFVLPVEVPPPSRELCAFLINEYSKVGFTTPYAMLQAMDVEKGAPWHLGFPLLLTREGGKLLKKTSDLQSLVDPRLKYLQLPYSPQADLAPQGITI